MAKEPVKFAKDGLPDPEGRENYIQQFCFGEYKKCGYYHSDSPDEEKKERVECPYCGWKFSQRGLARHQYSCSDNPKNAKLPNDPIHAAILEYHYELQEHLLSLFQEGYERDGFSYEEKEGRQIIAYFLKKGNERFKLQETYNFGSSKIAFEQI